MSLAFGHVDTNIVVLDVDGAGWTAEPFREALRRRGVLCLTTGPTTVRFVTHRDVNEQDVDVALERVREVLSEGPGGWRI